MRSSGFGEVEVLWEQSSWVQPGSCPWLQKVVLSFPHVLEKAEPNKQLEMLNPQNCWGFPHSAAAGASQGTNTILAAALWPCPSERSGQATDWAAAWVGHPSKGISAHSLLFP